MTTPVSPILQSQINMIYGLPEDIMLKPEQQYYCYLLTLMPIEGSAVDDLRENHVTIMSGVTSLHYVLLMRKVKLEQELAPIRVEVEQEAESKSKHKLTTDKRELVVSGDPRCKGYLDGIKILDGLLDNMKHIFDLLEHRRWMLTEKSVQTRHDIDRHS